LYADELVRPKPAPHRKLMQPCVLGEGEEAAPQLEQDMDLQIEITEREKVGLKSDAYISYKICTKVNGGLVWRGGAG
jgi:hypothetical protein